MISFYTRDGKQCDLEDLKGPDISIDEIANALANQGRYNGQTKKFYSVAEHCVHLCRYARYMFPKDTQIQKTLLLHDASEAFCGDIVYHLKGRLPGFLLVEDEVLSRILCKYKAYSWGNNRSLVHFLDRCICLDEMSALMAKVDPELSKSHLSPLGIKIKGWSPKKARREFLKEAKRLGIRD